MCFVLFLSYLINYDYSWLINMPKLTYIARMESGLIGFTVHIILPVC